MPTRRTPLDRPRKAMIDAETLKAFAELESVPMRRRRESQEFEQRAYALARRLNLEYEHFCMRCSVLDRERKPCHPPGYARNDSFWKVRAVRLQLLELAGLDAPDVKRARAAGPNEV
jgi:hypothetical protein